MAFLCGCGEPPSPAPSIAEPVPTAKVASHPRPNVIWILLDAARAQNFSVYGYDRPTSPNLEKLAARGTVFERAYSQASYTIASVPSYMTGRYFPVSSTSTRDWRLMFRTPPENESLLPTVLRNNGYFTKLISASRWITPDSRLYWEFEDPTYLPVSPVPFAYVEFENINTLFFEWLDSKPKQPFFAYLHTMDTHTPHIVKPPYDRWIDKNAVTSDQIDRDRGEAADGKAPYRFTDADREFLRAVYDGSIARADDNIGILLAKLDELGLTENTIVIIGSDHGEMLGEDGTSYGHSNEATEELFHVPLIMAGPGIPKGARVAEPAQNADIMPTILDLAGVKTDSEMQGKSLVPAMTGNPLSRHYVFAKLTEGLHDAKSIYLYAGDLRYEHVYKTNTDRLRLLPDSLVHVADVTDQRAAELAGFRSIVETEITPLLDAVKARPYASPDLPFIEPLSDKVEPADAVTNVHEKQDKKWSLKSGVLGSWGTEDVPPVTIELQIPNGTYQVSMRCYTSTNILYKAQQAADFSQVFDDPSYGGWHMRELGSYEVTDGTFRITVDDVPRKHQNLIESFRFVPPTGKGQSDEDASATEEGLKAMGYL